MFFVTPTVRNYRFAASTSGLRIGGQTIQQIGAGTSMPAAQTAYPEQRWRPAVLGLTAFRRGFHPPDAHIPMPVSGAVLLSISPLVFSFTVPDVAITKRVNPSPLVLSLSAPAVSVTRGAMTLSPSPLAFPVSLPSPTIRQTVHPSPLAVALAMPDVSLTPGMATLNPSPLAVAIALPDVAAVRGTAAYPDPLVLSLALPAVGVARSAFTFTPSPLALSLALPSVNVLRSAYTFTPSPLVMTLAVPAVLAIRLPVYLTPSPVAFSVGMPVATLTNIFFARPSPLTFPVVLPAVDVLRGPVFVYPDPLALRIFLPRLKRGVGTPTVGRVLQRVLYPVLLTGSADGMTDLFLSAQSVQGTVHLVGNDVLSVYVPNAAAVLPGILARLHGTLIVWERQIYSDGSELIAEVIRTPMTEAIRRDRGPTRDTLTLGGRLAAELVSGTARTLPSVMQLMAQSGSNSFRVPYNVDIRPGDTVSYGVHSFRVGAIQINLGVTSRELTLQETE